MTNFLKAILIFPFKLLYRVKSSSSEIPERKNTILIIWLGDGQGPILSGRNLIIGLKKRNPQSNLTLVVKSENVDFLSQNQIRVALGLTENDSILGSKEFSKIIRTKYDITLIVTIDKFRFQDHFLAWLSGAPRIIGSSSIDSNANIYEFICDRIVDISWKNNPNSHFTEILKKLFQQITDEISLSYSSTLFFNISDSEREDVHAKYKVPHGYKLIGLSFDAKKISDRWSADKIKDLIDELLRKYNSVLYFISSGSDDDIRRVINNLKKDIILVSNDNYPELLKIMSVSDLLITVESDIMHLAGFCNVPQISLFGNSNPFRWAPIGEMKRFIKKRDLIEDISADDVLTLSNDLIQ